MGQNSSQEYSRRGQSLEGLFRNVRPWLFNRICKGGHALTDPAHRGWSRRARSASRSGVAAALSAAPDARSSRSWSLYCSFNASATPPAQHNTCPHLASLACIMSSKGGISCQHHCKQHLISPEQLNVCGSSVCLKWPPYQGTKLTRNRGKVLNLQCS